MDHQAIITESDLERMLFDEAAEPKPLPFSLLERITKGFSYRMEIGKGGFAVVYKAMLENGAVAVKRLSSTYMYENEFFREVECLMKVKHKNVVRFLGYCVDTQGNMTRHKGKFVMADIQQRLLCFEYLPNGGLDHYIKDPSCGLEWTDRYDIIKGICEGLHHLHQINIVHLDLKPANILLDENMEPKITDFGISRSFEEDQTRVIPTKVVGTTGYMAPEFVRNLITKKYDLYSLGVIIMEILTGEKMCHDVETVWTREKISHVVDSVIKSWSNRLSISRGIDECEQLRVCAEIGIECIDFDPANRPVNMKHIIERLAETERTEKISVRIKMLDIGITSSNRRLHSLDTNEDKQWIITGEDDGHARIWNYQTQKKVNSLKLSERSEVLCIKFIPRKQWIAAASGYSIFVYSYETKMQKITSINAGNSDKSLHTLAVHPTKPYLLSSDYGNIKLWNWDKNWECTHIFEGNKNEACIYQIALSSKGTIASASLDCTIKVCSLDSAESNYTLSGHSACVKCLDFFMWDDREYLVTGSDDQTVMIWDMEQKICLCTLEASMSPVMFVSYRPDLQILVTGSQDGSIYLWKICSRIHRRAPRLEQTINIGGGGVLALACTMGRILITKQDAIAIVDIDCVNSREKSIDHCEKQLSVDARPREEQTSKVIAGTSIELPLLDVHPLEIRPSKPNEPIMCSLHLTNQTDAHAAFRITKESRESLRCSSQLPMYGIVPPRSTYTLDMITGYKMDLEKETKFNLVVQSSTSGERYITLFISQSECDEFFEEAEEMGNTVHEVTQNVIYAPHRDWRSKYCSHKIHPLKYCFYPQLSESVPCLLHLTNKTDEHLVFRLMDYWGGKSMSGSVPPRSACTLLTKGIYTSARILQSSVCTDTELECDAVLEKAKELGHAVYEATLKDMSRGDTSSELLAVRPTITKLVSYDMKMMLSLDAHPTEPWIVIGFDNGKFTVWNHESETKIVSFRISQEPVRYIKFDATKKWIVALTLNGFIHVYDCACVSQLQKITSFDASKANAGYSVGIHPTKPYLLSTSMTLWDGDKDWECTHTFGVEAMFRVAFNPEDTNSFASAASCEDCVKVWSLDSAEPDYILNGHSDRVNCLAFFKRGDRQYLITGSRDCTAKIWDMQTRECIHTLDGTISSVIHVIALPGRPYLVTCSANGTVHVWSSIDFRLKTTFHFEITSKSTGLVCLMGSRRIAMLQDESIYMLDINDHDEEAVAADRGKQ